MQKITITADPTHMRIKAGDVVHVTVNGNTGEYRVIEEHVEIQPFHRFGTYRLEQVRRPSHSEAYAEQKQRMYEIAAKLGYDVVLKKDQPVHPGGTEAELQYRLREARFSRTQGHQVDLAATLLDIVELLAKRQVG